MKRTHAPPPAQCPHCGYDQRGVMASWTQSCPLTGTCAECGQAFEWRAVLNKAPPKAWPPPRDRAVVAQIMRHARESQPIRHWIHVGLAALYVFLLPLGTAPKDGALVALLVWSVGRLRRTWRCYTTLARDPLGTSMALWAGWTALSITWSTDPAHGFDEFKAMRILITPLLLWPVIEHVTILVAALLAGVFVSNVVQLLQQLQVLNLHPHAGESDRLRGLLHPSITGTFCIAAICLHLAAACAWTGWKRWVSLAGMAAAACGLVFTGSRAQWLAGGVAVPATAVLLMIRSVPARRVIPLTVAAMLVLGATSAPWLAPYVKHRIDMAIQDFEKSETTGSVSSSTQLRIASWEWAWWLFRQAPVRGIGAGSYPTEVKKTPGYLEAVAREPDREKYLTRAHPHSTYLYTLCCTGLVGAAILLSVLVIMAIRAWRIHADFAYAPAIFFVLLAWLIGAAFDSNFTLNANCLGLLALLMPIVSPRRPPPL